MKRRLFTDEDVTPTEALIRKASRSAMDYYACILAMSGNYRKQWQYNRGNGWTLKVDDKRKALYYLIAFEEGIEITLTVRDGERENFLKSDLYPQLRSAKKYAEGYALRFEIESSAECENVIRFLTELMKMRSSVHQ